MRRLARAGRWSAVLAGAAVLLGIGAPMLTGATVTAADSRPSSAVSLASGLAALSTAEPTALDLQPAVPRGYRPPASPPAVKASTAATPRSSAAPAPRTPAPAPARTQAPAPAPAAPAGAGLPLPVKVGSSTQVVTVVAPSSRSTSATLTAWQLGSGGWTAVAGPVTAKVGAQGVGAASETTSRTPAGTFTLTEGFGRLANPGTRVPYRTIDAQDWWVSDVASPLYNQHTRCAVHACPFNEAAGENLWSEGVVYNHALVIDYNRGGTRGAGSAFFLHDTNGLATAGCVAIDDARLVAIMKWLDPAQRPLISIGVG